MIYVVFFVHIEILYIIFACQSVSVVSATESWGSGLRNRQSLQSSMKCEPSNKHRLQRPRENQKDPEIRRNLPMKTKQKTRIQACDLLMSLPKSFEAPNKTT